MGTKSWRTIALGFFVSIFCQLAATPASVAQTWELGPQRFATNAMQAAPPLRVRAYGGPSLRSFSFVARVGGVSFEAIAKPEQSLSGSSISLSYDTAKPDGSRLVVRTGWFSTLRASIPDWQLVPIARFADSEHHGVVSLFGEGPDQRYYYLQYHDAFANTLLGMRLLQADILFINLASHWQLPKYNGSPLLGLGEYYPNTAQSISAAQVLSTTLQGHRWRSWVLTDADTQPTFGAVNGELVIRANPYFFFWNLNEDELRRYSQNGPEPAVYNVTSLTDAMRSRATTLAEYNPNVFQSFQRTAQYAAFFRYVKSTNPSNWSQFVSQMRSASFSPSVATPTTWERN